MRQLTLEQFNELLAETSIKPRTKRELRFVTSTAHLSSQDWEESELLNITDRTGNKGVLLIDIDENLHIVPYELSLGLRSQSTGRLSPVICDFCRTWQAGSGAASATFKKDPRSNDSIGYLCCGDLGCSSHVRTKTPASLCSRAQLREDLTNEQRVERLQNRLRRLVSELSFSNRTGEH